MNHKLDESDTKDNVVAIEGKLTKSVVTVQ